jgi:hypothetical protein
LLVVNHNGAGNKTDYFLTRQVRYEVHLQPAELDTGLRAELDLSLHNGAPSAGLPNAVIGPYDARFAPGQNLSLLSIYTPTLVRKATLGDKEVKIPTSPELGRFVHAGELSLPSKTTADLHLDLSGRVPLSAGWYYLDLVRQPTVHPDKVEIRIEVAPGWRIVDTEGVTQVTDRRGIRSLVLTEDTRIGVQVRRTGTLGIWDRLAG